jgi:hypothetical protein
MITELHPAVTGTNGATLTPDVVRQIADMQRIWTKATVTHAETWDCWQVAVCSGWERPAITARRFRGWQR